MMAKSFAETHPHNPNATCECEHWQSCIDCHPTAHGEKYITDAMKVRQAVSNAVLQESKDGSPCPEFWDWLPKAYNFEGNGNFTKYNMEVAFLAGKQASQRTWVGLTEREVELLDGMIEVQLHHAAQCDSIANRTMADKQKGWDIERVELLRKLKEVNT